jgi:hypothetical protein
MLRFSGVANGNLSINLEELFVLGFDVTLQANSDARVVIDTIRIGAVPEPAALPLILVSLLSLRRRLRACR